MRKRIIALIMAVSIAIASAFLLVGCDKKNVAMNEVETIGIIGAMEEEVISLKNAMTAEEVIKFAGKEYYKGVLGKANVVVVQCDMGKVNAGICANTLIDRFDCTKIINTGVAGALDDKLKRGDVIISTDAVQHDFDATPIGYEKGEVPYTGKVAFAADEEMVKVAYESAKEYNKQGDAYKGRICSGDQFIASEEVKKRIVSDFGGLCCDMESAAIAQVCYLNDIPFVILRVVSDSPGETEIEEYQASESDYSLSCANIVKYMMDKYY